jgi:hypothetical protein
MSWLVVWNMAFIFPYLGNVIIPTDELHHFSEGMKQTTNQCHFVILGPHPFFFPGSSSRQGIAVNRVQTPPWGLTPFTLDSCVAVATR